MKNITKLSKIIAVIVATFATIGLLLSGKFNSKDIPQGSSIKNWRGALFETRRAIVDRQLPLYAAGVSYYATLAFFPLMVALVALAALAIDVSKLQDVLAAVSQYAPRDLAGLLNAQLENAIQNKASSVLTAAFAIGLALFGVSGAAHNLIKALNEAYNISERRNLVKQRLISLLLTLCLIVFIGLVLVLLVINPLIITSFGIPIWIAEIYPILRWVILILFVLFSLVLLYRYAPNHTSKHHKWISWGSLIATFLWMAVTVLFFVYVQKLSYFSNSYSLFAGIIVLMIWLNLSALSVLVGARVDHKLEG